MAIEKKVKSAVAVAPIDGVAKPKMRRAAGAKKAVADPELTPTYRTPMESENMTWTEAALAAKATGQMFEGSVAATWSLKRIDARSEQRAHGLSLVGSDRKMAESDVADFQRISEESGLQRFAAVAIADNMQEYPDYKASIAQLDASVHPGLIKSIVEFNEVSNAMVAAKEVRKAAEMQSMTAGDLRAAAQSMQADPDDSDINQVHAGNVVGLTDALTTDVKSMTAGGPVGGVQSEFLGSADGVSVNEVEGGFIVSFPFNRQFAGMMDRVPNAVFNKENFAKMYEVPDGSAVQLAKVVDAMRVENRAIDAEFESIWALAKSTGVDAQNDVGTASGVVPQVSSFLDLGRVYRGEIVNANSRFVAQFTGFGKQDGAAFLTIHRLASLDNDKLLKGDKVGIVYDDRFRGAVSDLSRNKSAAELEADYEINLGRKVDGVTVSDRGDKIGVAFEINPVMVSRIRRVEGAAFNKEDKTWEIPKAKQEFALFAAQDLRNEFVVDAKDVAALHQVAESKIDGAKVWPAFTKDGQEYYGTVLAVGDRYALQNSGRENFTLHHLSALDQEPIKGHHLDIQYNKGVGMVHDKDQQRGQDRGR